MEWFLELANNEKQWCSFTEKRHEESDNAMEMPEIDKACELEAESTPVSYILW